MAEEEKKEYKTNRTTKFDFTTLLGFIAMGALLVIGISLFVTNVISRADLGLVKQILTYVLYGVLAIVGFYYCSTKNNPLWFGLWTVAVALIVLGLVL